MLRFITAGESHGPLETAIIEGVPANLPIDIDKINENLARRQMGYGAGNRMKIEKDQVRITSGVRHGLTLGSPITLIVENRDFKKWTEIMSVEDVEDGIKKRRTVHHPRPGHADLVGGIKYGFKDLRNVLERSSARETTMRVAVGSIAQQILDGLDIEIIAYVKALGGVEGKVDATSLSYEEIRQTTDESELKMIDPSIDEEIKAKIDQAKKDGTTLGGVIEVIAKNVPAGLGSYTHWDKKLDAKLVGAMVSINAFKAAEIGDGVEVASRFGNELMDEIAYDDTQGFYRLTNHMGGFEGGMTTGMPIIVRGYKKPIPTQYHPLQSVDIYTKEPYKASIERSDITAVPRAAIIGETVIATELAQAILEKFPHDDYNELVKAVNNYREYAKNPDIWQNEGE